MQFFIMKQKHEQRKIYLYLLNKIETKLFEIIFLSFYSIPKKLNDFRSCMGKETLKKKSRKHVFLQLKY